MYRYADRYIISGRGTVKLRDLEKKLTALGYRENGGTKHAKWVNRNGNAPVMVPRHTEINEFTAKGIIRDAEKGKDK